MNLRRKHITIKDIADRAGVSIQTVSRVINNRPDVSPDTREKIQTIIKESGYVPSALARDLASRRNRTLGLLVTDITDYYFAEVVVGANAEALEQGYFFILGSTKILREEEPRYLHMLAERHVDGVLFVRAGVENDEMHLQHLYDSGIPVVTTGYHQTEFTVVEVNNRQGGMLATRYLLDLGHRQIATVTGPTCAKASQDRLQGYLDALGEWGIAPEETLILEGDWTHISGYQALKKRTGKGPAFTALFAHNDRMAIGAMAAIREAGLRVPEDISVVGYDDIPETAFTVPPLTTIHQPLIDLGRTAAQVLIERIENPSIRPTELLLDAALVERDSCKMVE